MSYGNIIQFSDIQGIKENNQTAFDTVWRYHVVDKRPLSNEIAAETFAGCSEGLLADMQEARAIAIKDEIASDLGGPIGRNLAHYFRLVAEKWGLELMKEGNELYFSSKYMGMSDEETLDDMVGKTITSIEVEGKGEITFNRSDSSVYIHYHWQESRETVEIEEVIGDWDDLIDSPLLIAEKVTQKVAPEENPMEGTWTFYKFATVHGYVTVRWYGEHSGYYSEEANISRME